MVTKEQLDSQIKDLKRKELTRRLIAGGVGLVGGVLGFLVARKMKSNTASSVTITSSMALLSGFAYLVITEKKAIERKQDLEQTKLEINQLRTPVSVSTATTTATPSGGGSTGSPSSESTPKEPSTSTSVK